MAFKRRDKGAGIVKLREDLGAGRFQPCYLLAGEDVVRTRSVVDFIFDKVLGDAGKAFNAHVYDGDEVGPDKVLQQALSFPMMCPHQVLWVKRADQLCSTLADEIALEQYLAKPSPETILILSAEKLDGRKKWVKAGKSAGFLFEMEPPQGQELERWVQKAARERGMTLDRTTVNLLIEQVGEDLVALGHEVDKLAVIVLDEGKLPDADTLKALIFEQRAVDPFEFLGRLGPGKAAEGLIHLQHYLSEGRSAYELTPLIVWKVKQSAQVSTMLEDGMDERQIVGALGASPYAIKQAAGVARQWGAPRVQRALRAVSKADRQLKSSAMAPEAVLEAVILEICA